MIVPRLRSEARGGSSAGASTRYSNSSGVYGGKVHHANDPDLKRALQYSYTSQTVRKWEKRWVIIHETSMKVHKWMPAPVSAATLASQIVADKAAALTTSSSESNPVEQEKPTTEVETSNPAEDSTSAATQDTQMLVDDESTSQSSQA